MDIKHLEQLRNSIDKYIESVENVEQRCGKSSNYPEETQQETIDMRDFRKMQLQNRMKAVLELLSEEW